MGKLWYIHNGILFSNKNEITANTCNTIHRHCWGQEARHKRMPRIWFYLYDFYDVGNQLDQWLPGASKGQRVD